MLSKLSVDCGRTPLVAGEEYGVSDGDEPDDIVEIRHALEQSGGRKLFGYAYLDDKYGIMFRLEDVNVESFKEGKDQEAYDELMEIVYKNAASQKDAREKGACG